MKTYMRVSVEANPYCMDEKQTELRVEVSHGIEKIHWSKVVPHDYMRSIFERMIEEAVLEIKKIMKADDERRQALKEINE